MGARGTAAWPDHVPGMLLPFPGGGDTHPPPAPGASSAPQPCWGCSRLAPAPGVWVVPPSPQDMSSSPVGSCLVPQSRAGTTASYARLHLPSAASAKQGRWGTTQCGFTSVTPGQGSGRAPPPRPSPLSGVCPPPHSLLPGLFPCSQGCSAAAAAALLEAQQSLLPARACSQGNIYIEDIYIYLCNNVLICNTPGKSNPWGHRQ